MTTVAGPTPPPRGSPPPGGAADGDRWVPAVVVAACTWAGAALVVVPPLPLTVAALAVAARWRRPALVALAALALAGTLAGRAHDGLDPAPTGPWAGWATLRSDPEPVGAAVRVDVEVAGRRLEAWARGRSATALADRLLGERVELAGRVGPAPDDAPWLTRRHVVGRLDVRRVGRAAPADPVHGAANGLRRTLAAGAEVLGAERRALFLGLVLGDDRDHDALVVDDFRGSGLSHLMAVSGSNVAFVLVLAGPVLRRLRPAPRLVVLLAVVAGFALVTRFEPSVLRASAMAGTAAVAAAVGRPATGRRALAVAVTVVVLLDPFLVDSVGFRLSVAASAGILWWAPALAARLPGPRPLAVAVAVTAAAQLAVAPLLVTTFGGVPVASLPANVVAAPLAGPVMVWGLPAGLAAGVVGPPVDGWLHAPTAVLVGAVAAVARWGAALPLGELGVAEVGVVVAGAGVAAGAARRRSRSVRRAGVAVGVAVVFAAVAAPGLRLAVAEPAPVAGLGPGADLRRSGGAAVLVVDGTARSADVLAGLRRRGVGRLDLVVCRSGGARVAEVVALLHRRVGVGAVVAPPGHRVPGAVTPPRRAHVVVGGVVVGLEVRSGVLDVDVRHSASARAPPSSPPPPRGDGPGGVERPPV